MTKVSQRAIIIALTEALKLARYELEKYTEQSGWAGRPPHYKNLVIDEAISLGEECQ